MISGSEAVLSYSSVRPAVLIPHGFAEKRSFFKEIFDKLLLGTLIEPES